MKKKPRIYTYKITFPSQGWWYWGYHKERFYGEDYFGSPCTHAEKWKSFGFKKQILELFDTVDEARKVESRLIAPDLSNPLCLNENNYGGFSLESVKQGGLTRAMDKDGMIEMRRKSALSRQKEVILTNLQTGEQLQFNGVTEAAAFINGSKGRLSEICQNRVGRKTHKGFSARWVYSSPYSL